MRDYLTIGSSPYGEDCAQLGAPDYAERSRAEIAALKNQMLRVIGQGPGWTELRRKGFPHDFGTYHELVVVYEDSDEDASEYAYKAEDECPEFWDDEALAELAAAGFPTKSNRPEQSDDSLEEASA